MGRSARQYLLSVFAERAACPERAVKCLARDAELLAKLADNRLPLAYGGQPESAGTTEADLARRLAAHPLPGPLRFPRQTAPHRPGSHPGWGQFAVKQ